MCLDSRTDVGDLVTAHILTGVSEPGAEPIGVLLAGGQGRRLGGGKALAKLAGRPLISYPLAAMRAAVRDVVIVAKPDTELSAVQEGAEVWREPAEPRHPLVGIVYALSRAAGRDVLVCAADLPFITAAALGQLARADADGAAAVIATAPGSGLQPLLGRYRALCGVLLAAEAREGTAPVRDVVTALEPRLVELDDSALLFNVNSPADLEAAEAILAARR
jgi:molybdopterin-guanine dinucleotide biosynthesis protein A